MPAPPLLALRVVFVQRLQLHDQIDLCMSTLLLMSRGCPLTPGLLLLRFRYKFASGSRARFLEVWGWDVVFGNHSIVSPTDSLSLVVVIQL